MMPTVMVVLPEPLCGAAITIDFMVYPFTSFTTARPSSK